MESVLSEAAQRVRRNLVIFAFGLWAFSSPWVRPTAGGEINLFASGVAANEHAVFWGGWLLVAYSIVHFWLQAKDSELRLAERHHQDKLAAAYQIADLTSASEIGKEMRQFNEQNELYSPSVVTQIDDIHRKSKSDTQTSRGAREAYELIMVQAPVALDWHLERKSGQWAAGKDRRCHQKRVLVFEWKLTFWFGIVSVIVPPLLFHLSLAMG